MNTLVEFVLRLIGYENGIVRVYMNERNPLRPRYEVPKGDVVLEDQLTTQSLVDSTRFKVCFILKQLNLILGSI